MDIMNILGLESRIKQAQKESPQERYARIDLDLGIAENIGIDIKILITGDYLAKIKYDGSATGCYFKFDNKRSSIIYPTEFRKRHTPFIDFNCIYLTNPTAQTGKHLIFFVGGAFAGEIEPATGAKVGIVDSDGADMTPAKDARFIAHTVGQVDRVVLDTIDVADPIASAATKVKWAIVHVDTADVMIGDSTVTNKAGAHAGVLASNGADIALEHVDLHEVYIVNEDGATKPYWAAIYTEEAT